MAVTWLTSAGDLGTLTERVTTEILLQASSNTDSVSYSLISGNLPRGMRLNGNIIKGSPTEVRKYTVSRFVIRARDSEDIEDRTFSISVDGADLPEWLTPEGFLNVGQGENYFVLDNALVDFQLEADDTDEIIGDVLEYYLVPNGGELPPGLSLSREGKIYGFTDPIFSVEYSSNVTGAYDTGAYDILPLDKPEARSNGFDSFFYDNVTFDYTENTRVPRRLSRFYSFIVAVSDGVNEIRRLFRMWVVTEEFLQADNSIVQVDTNLFKADNTRDRVPIWITDSYLGRRRANNYIIVYLDVYDPPSLSGTITYFLLDTNPADGSPSQLPPGMILDSVTGEIAGKVGYQSAVTENYKFTLRAIDFPVSLTSGTLNYRGSWNSSVIYDINDSIEYLGLIYVCVFIHRNKVPGIDVDFWNQATASAEKTFNIDIIGEIESSIEWISDPFVGEIKPNQPSRLFVEARSLMYGGRVGYQLISGSLPPGLEFLGTGIIQGKVQQFADQTGPGLTRFFERDSSISDSTGTFDYTVSFDDNTTRFDKLFKFTVRARDAANFAQVDKQFEIRVVADNTKTFANLYLKAFQSKDKRLSWYSFITDSNVFKISEIYRYGDPNYGVQNEIKILIFAGIESTEAVKYVQAMSRNHYRKRIRFGDVKIAQAKNIDTQKPIYEIVYVEVVDEYEKSRISIDQIIELPNYIESKVLISYNSIKVDSDIPLISDSDHQRIFPNSIKNMRSRIKAVGDRDREFLPLWMRSIQDDSLSEAGYIKALPLCYALPGFGEAIVSKIKSSNFDFKTIDFEADRYLIDVLNGEIENKYLAFPQRDVLNKLANPSQDTITVTPAVFGSFDNDTATFDSETLTFDQG